MLTINATRRYRAANTYPGMITVQWITIKTHSLLHLIRDLRLSRIVFIIRTERERVNDVTEVVTVFVVLQVRDELVDAAGRRLEGLSRREVEVADDFVDTDAP